MNLNDLNAGQIRPVLLFALSTVHYVDMVGSVLPLSSNEAKSINPHHSGGLH